MGCDTATRRVRRAVWSDGTTTAQFLCFLTLPVADFKRLRVSLVLEGSSGALTVTTAVLYANTEAGLASATSADMPTAAPTTLTANGAAYGASYQDLDVAKQWVVIGVRVKNSGGSTKREMGTVTLTCDLAE